MIQVDKQKIYFSLPELQRIFRENDVRREPLTKDLLQAYICPHCQVLVMALYLTPVPIKEQTQEFFGLEKPYGLSKFGVTTSKHEVTPKYKSVMIQAGGQTAELIRESSHFGVGARVAGACKISHVVHFPGEFDLSRYLFALARRVMSQEWFAAPARYFTTMRTCLDPAYPDLAQRNANDMFETIKGRLYIAKDVTGRGTDMWMMARADWGFCVTNAIDKMVPPRKEAA